MRLFVIAAAAARYAHLIQRDSITQGVRDVVDRAAPGWVVALVGCGWCLTVWTATAAVAVDRHAPVVNDVAAVAFAAGWAMWATGRILGDDQ